MVSAHGNFGKRFATRNTKTLTPLSSTPSWVIDLVGLASYSLLGHERSAPPRLPVPAAAACTIRRHRVGLRLLRLFLTAASLPCCLYCSRVRFRRHLPHLPGHGFCVGLVGIGCGHVCSRGSVETKLFTVSQGRSRCAIIRYTRVQCFSFNWYLHPST